MTCESVRTAAESRLTEGSEERLTRVRERLQRLVALGEGASVGLSGLEGIAGAKMSQLLTSGRLEKTLDELEARGERVFDSRRMRGSGPLNGSALFARSLARAARRVGDVHIAVGEGGFSDVFACQAPHVVWSGWNGRAVLKCCEYGYEGLGMAFAEVEALALSTLPPHPGVVSMASCHLDYSERMAYLVLGNAGESLYNLREEYDFSPEQIRRLLQQLLEAVAHLHEHGVCHRDIKPANVVVSEEGVATLVDFGTARVPGIQDLLEDARMYGTPGFQAPELLFGDAYFDDFAQYAKVDVFSLGCVAYYLVCAQDLFCDIGTYERGTWACRLDPRVSDVVESCDPDMVTPLDCVMNMCRFSDFALSEARAKDFEEEWLMDAPGLGDTVLREQLEVDLKDFDDDLMDLLEALLCPDPAQRPSAAEALDMPFFEKGRARDALAFGEAIVVSA